MAKQKRSLASRIKTTPVEVVPTQPSVEDQERALEKLLKKKEVPTKKKTRVSVDFPNDIYEVMKQDTQKKGMTLKGFIVAMVREFYEEKGML